MATAEQIQKSELDQFKSWNNKQNLAFFGKTDLTRAAGSQGLSNTKDQFRVHTEMVATKFYDGDVAKAKPVEYEADPLFTSSRSKPRGLKVFPDDLFQTKHDEPPRSITLVGPAGSGKTTILKRYIQDHPNDFIFLLCIQDFQNANDITVFNFLFPNKSEISAELLKKGFQWMENNPNEITFILDSLDTLSFLPTHNHVKKDGDLYAPEEVLGMIMTGEIFSEAKMISASREHGIVDYPEKIRADRIISLVGLSEEAVRKYIGDVLNGEGEEFCKNVERQHPGLWVLLSTPVFLNLSLLGHFAEKKQPLEFIPTTASGVVAKSLFQLSESPHGGTIANFKEIAGKLKKLSYYGIVNGMVTFNKDALEKVGLTPKEATSWSIFVPGKTKKLTGLELFQGRNLLFFCHQCIQEFLAAAWINEMKWADFEKFVKEELTKARLLVVRRFLVGLLLNEEVSRYALEHGIIKEIPDKENKKKLLGEFLTSTIKKTKKKEERMDLYVSLSEAGDGAKEIIKSGIRSIDLVGLETTRVSDLHAIGSIVKYLNELYDIDLSDCDLTPSKMESLLCGLDLRDGDIPIKVDKLRFKKNCSLGVEGISTLARILKKLNAEKVVLDCSNPSPEQLVKFSTELPIHKVKIKKLHLKEFGEIPVGAEMNEALCLLLPHISHRLNLRGWDLGREVVEALEKTLYEEHRRDSRYLTDVLYGKDGEGRIQIKNLKDYIEELLNQSTFPLSVMREFARVALNLSSIECQDINDSNIRKATDERRAYLLKWEQKNGDEATFKKLKRLVDDFQTSKKTE